MEWSPTLLCLGICVVCFTAGVKAESSTCFIESTQSHGFCKHGCCSTSLDSNQRCCEKPDVLEWIVAVSILGGLLAITWIICCFCLVRMAIKNTVGSKKKVRPSKKQKETEKKTQFVDAAPNGGNYYNNFYRPELVQPPRLEELQPTPRLKSNLKNNPLPLEKKVRKERRMYPIKKNTEFTQVSYQPPSRESEGQEWQSGYRSRQNEFDSNHHGRPSTEPRTPDSYF